MNYIEEDTRDHTYNSTRIGQTRVRTLTHYLSQLSPYRYSEVINNRKVCEIQVKTASVYRNKSRGEETTKHSQTKFPSDLSADQVHVEFVHINPTRDRIGDTCRGTKHDNSQLC